MSGSCDLVGVVITSDVSLQRMEISSYWCPISVISYGSICAVATPFREIGGSSRLWVCVQVHDHYASKVVLLCLN